MELYYNLKNFRSKKAELAALIAELDYWRHKAEKLGTVAYDSVKVQGGLKEPNPYLDAILRLSSLIEKRIAELANLDAWFISVVALIPEDVDRALLFAYYSHGLSVKHIAKENNYALSYAYRRLKKATKAFSLAAERQRKSGGVLKTFLT